MMQVSNTDNMFKNKVFKVLRRLIVVFFFFCWDSMYNREKCETCAETKCTGFILCAVYRHPGFLITCTCTPRQQYCCHHGLLFSVFKVHIKEGS